MATTFAAYENWKSALIGGLRGTVVEIGAGRGRNFGALSRDVTWIGCEPDRRRRAALAAAARRAGQVREPLDATAEQLPFADGSVDAVLATVVLCSVRDQAVALAEIARVLRPGGRLVFAEHVAAPAGTRTRGLQRAVAPLSRALDHGCDPARETEDAVRASPLTIISVNRFELAVLGRLRVPFVVGAAERAAVQSTAGPPLPRALGDDT